MRLMFNGRPKADTWDPPPVFSPDVGLRAPDAWTFNGALVFPPAVADQLHHALIGVGELLPLPYRGEEWQVLNISLVDCLDAAATEWLMTPDGKRVSARKLAFVGHRLPDNLFKVPPAISRNLCVDSGDDRDDQFKPLVESLQLSGLLFELIWDSEAGLAA